MDSKTQMSFMYLFERVGEPLYFGPRGGSSKVYYEFPQANLDKNTKHASDSFRKNVRPEDTMVEVKTPTDKPNLGSIARGCPSSTLFSYFIPSHRQAAIQLREILLSQTNQKDFLAMACYCRDSRTKMKDVTINPKLWIYAFASACLQRPDLTSLKMPAIWEIMPDQFVGPTAVREAQKQAVLPEADRKRIVIPRNNTGNDSNPENLVAYFREDMGINSHHWHWHLVYRTDAPLEGPGKYDRKGELFYWMHHDVLARYEAERLAHGLGRIKPFDLFDTIKEGYFPKLYDTNSGIVWGTRQADTKLREVNRIFSEADPTPLRVVFEDMRTYRTRLFEAIDTGMILLPEGRTVKLTVENGIDILGNLIEAATPPVTQAGFSNNKFYGDYHGSGHVAIAFAHDPEYSHREPVAVMGDTATAMRDPVFYRWHKHIDEIFDRYKLTLPPYTLNELVFPGIRLTDIAVQMEGQGERNRLDTYWMESDLDLSRGLDFGRTNTNNLGPIWATMTHLNHRNFSYRIVVQNTGRDNVSGMFRIFMAPRQTENRKRFEMAQQRLQFIAMDRFEKVLTPGENVVTRQSTESTLTIPWEKTFRDLERNNTPTPEESICGCGWPQHMLVPRGTPSGMPFDLYVIVTNGAEDLIPRKNPMPNGCKESLIYCGALGEKYPDKRAMGYPFDRKPRGPLPNLDAFVKDVPNSRTTQIRIFHLADVPPVRRSNGAPPSMPKIMMGTPPTSPTGSPRPSKFTFPDRSPSPINSTTEGRTGGRNSWWDQPYRGYQRHRDGSPTRQRTGWPRGWSRDE